MDFLSRLNKIFNIQESPAAPTKPSVPKAPSAPKPSTSPFPTVRPGTEPAPRAKTASPAAPPRPSTTPISPKPSTSPFPTVRPGTEPTPRAKKSIKESYEEFVDPGTQQLFRTGHQNYGFSKHPMIRQFGNDIANKAYNYSSDKLYRSLQNLQHMPAGQRKQALMSIMMNTLPKIVQLEAPIKKELEQIAIDIVAKMYNIKDEDKKRLKAFIRKPSAEQSDDSDDSDDIEDVNESDFEDQVNKRYSLNLLSQGAGIHGMYDAHLQDEIKDRIDRLSPKLAELYSQFGKGSAHGYWMMNFNMLLGMSLGGAVGTANINQNGEVVAQGVIFPVLVQELIKGVIMLLSHHQFSDLEDRYTKRILKAADTLHDEFPQIMVGPRVWRTFIDVLPKEYKNRLMDVVATLAKAHPKELNIIMVKLGQAIARDEKPEESQAASALRDLLDRVVPVETPEDIANYIEDEDEYNNDYETEEDYGTAEDYETEEDYGTEDEYDDRF